ncbi:hypothetical protein AB9P05_24680 [Roseivirga sp. BDSF3-8]|uniref:hypothetical protein n=1 Tax=Roseivirga sp. BDSF3-8 TaxID=3241598 RepID=UPI0035326751
MAVIENNPWIEGARGMVRGAIVYRQRAGRTIVSARPATSSRPLSEKQKAHHRRFREATAYSKGVKEDAALFAKYEAAAEGFISWQNLAVRDYMHAPVVEKVVAGAFTGKAGEALEVYASDDFGICSLRVTVMDGRGAVLESGECNELIANGVYAYNLKSDMDMANGVSVRVEAADAAGNVTVYEEELVAGGDEGRANSPSSAGASVHKGSGKQGLGGYGLQGGRPDGATKTTSRRPWNCIRMKNPGETVFLRMKGAGDNLILTNRYEWDGQEHAAIIVTDLIRDSNTRVASIPEALRACNGIDWFITKP